MEISNEIVMLSIGVLAAFFIKGLCGFANTLVLGAIASYTVSNSVITPIDLLLTIPMNIILALKNREKIDKKVASLLILFVLLGAIPGALFLANANTDFLKILFGFVVIFVSIDMYLRDKRKIKKKSHPLFMMALGLVSGFLCGIFGIGALLATYVSRTCEDTSSFKGTLCIVFLADNLFRIVLYIATDIITKEVALTGLFLFPIALFSMFIGMKFSTKIKESTAKKLIYIVLFLSGLSLVVTNVILLV